MEADLHAAALVAFAPTTIALAWYFRHPADPLRSWWAEGRRRILYGVATLVGFFVAFAVTVPAYKGGYGPVAQLWLPCVVAVSIAVGASRRAVRLSSFVALVGVAILLGNHYNRLVYSPQRCAYTGKDETFIKHSCNRAAKAVGLWHSGFSGIYGVRVEPTPP